MCQIMARFHRAVRYGSVRFGTVRCGAVQCGSERDGSVTLNPACVSTADSTLMLVQGLSRMAIAAAAT